MAAHKRTTRFRNTRPPVNETAVRMVTGLMPVATVAKLLDVPSSTLYYHVRHENIPHVLIGRFKLIRLEDAIAFMEEAWRPHPDEVA